MCEIVPFPLRGRYREEADRQDRMRARFNLRPRDAGSYPPIARLTVQDEEPSDSFGMTPQQLYELDRLESGTPDALFLHVCARELAGDLDE